jgi:hypothetical protein
MITPEEWRVVPDFPNYWVSNQARVLGPNGFLKLSPLQGRKYTRVKLYGGSRNRSKAYRIHRLVLEVFVGPCPAGKQGCHNDDDQFNNHLDNLAWKTTLENAQDRVRNGHQRMGSGIANSELIESQALEIKRRLISENSRQIVGTLAKEFNVSISTIYQIRYKRTWLHV